MSGATDDGGGGDGGCGAHIVIVGLKMQLSLSELTYELRWHHRDMTVEGVRRHLVPFGTVWYCWFRQVPYFLLRMTHG